MVKEREITDLVVGLHKEKDIPAAFLGHIVESVLAESSVSTFIYKPAQPISTVRRHLIIIRNWPKKKSVSTKSSSGYERDPEHRCSDSLLRFGSDLECP